jgi:predicted dehydrogenase
MCRQVISQAVVRRRDMAVKTVRIAVVGTGVMGREHIQSLGKVADARIVALCDPVEDLVQRVAEPLGVPAYSDFEKLLAEEGLDAVYLCVPPHQHGEMEILAARKGLHLYVEKPVSLFIDQACRNWEVFQQTGILTQVGYQMRYSPANRQAKDFLADKPVGTAHAWRWGGIPDRAWWRRYDLGGGQFVEQATHQIDLLRWLLGEVETVSSTRSIGRLLRDEADLTIPDSQIAVLQFASGAVATVNISCALGKGWSGGMEFVVRNAKVGLRGDGITVEPEGTYPVPKLPTSALSADAAFVRAVATGDRSLLLSPYDDGIKTLAVTLAANLSAEDGGRAVKVKDLLNSFA